MSLGHTVTLPTGAKMPAVGFGTFANEGSKGESYKAAKCALEIGYRHLDCAWFYQNEGEIGDAIHDFLSEHPDVKRSDIFVTTKVWNHLHEPDEVKWSFEDSLKKLRLDYVDAYLIHWPIAAEKDTATMLPKIGADGKYVIKKELTEDPTPTWRVLEHIYESGKAKSIGVSNFTIAHLEHLRKVAKIQPHINQIEVHPFLPNNDLVKYCQDHNITVVAYSPLGSQNQVPTTGERVSENPLLNEVAKKGGHTLAQTLIAWGVKRGYAVLPKSSNPERIKSNFIAYDMPEEEFAAVNKVAEGRHCRFVNMKDTFGYDVWPEEA